MLCRPVNGRRHHGPLSGNHAKGREKNKKEKNVKETSSQGDSLPLSFGKKKAWQRKPTWGRLTYKNTKTPRPAKLNPKKESGAKKTNWE